MESATVGSNALRRPQTRLPLRASFAGLIGFLLSTGEIAAADSAPQVSLVSTPSPMIATVGGAVTFSGSATGTPPIAYQWNFNGVPLAGAVGSNLTTSNLTTAQSGRYTLTASNSAGTAASSPCYLTVINAGPSSLPIDPYYSPVLQGSPMMPMTLAAQSDGKVLVGLFNQNPDGKYTFTLQRLGTDGAVDVPFGTFANAALNITGIAFGGGTSIEILADGRIFIGVSDFSSQMTHYARLNSDGHHDSSFPSEVVLPGAHILLPDGRFMIESIVSNVASLSRFTSSGDPDPTYPATSITLAPPYISGFPPPPPSPLYLGFRSTTTPSGQILVAFVSQQDGDSHTRRGQDISTIIRLNSDGTLDQTFRPIVVPEALNSITYVAGRINYVGIATDPIIGLFISFHTGRLNADGTFDPTYTSLSTNPAGTVKFITANYGVSGDGSVYFYTNATNAIARYDPDGMRDPDFSARIPASLSQGISNIKPSDGGRLIAETPPPRPDGTNPGSVICILPDTHASATRLANLSVRQVAGSGSDTLIEGFIINGIGSTTLLLRGAGPALAGFGIGHPLADPTLTVFNSAGVQLAANDNWGDVGFADIIAASSADVGAFALPVGSKDSAALVTLPAGAFTVQIGNSGVAGVALAEAYDTGSNSAARVTNFSGRASAGTGDATFIAGFIVRGSNVKHLLIRAVGPSLAQFGVAGALSDPQLTLFSGATPVAVNSSWAGATDLNAAFAAVGAFSLPTNSRDAALLVTLPTGAYTAQVTSTSGATGVVLLEVYEMR